MTNWEKYVNTFLEILEVDRAAVENLKYQDVPQWDSVGHMELVSGLEEVFDIMMDAGDIIDFNSFAKGIEIMEKYGIVIARDVQG